MAAISVVELTYTAQRFIGSTYKPFEMFMISGALYMIIIYATRTRHRPGWTAGPGSSDGMGALP